MIVVPCPRWVLTGSLVAVSFFTSGFALAEVRINEFMASNNRTLTDDFGASSDWIELHNPGTEHVNLLGWSLTDRADEPAQWRFPRRILEPGGYLVVFASNRDRKLPDQPLHTNFALSAGGEYLGLYRPDGSMASEFTPQYPPQAADVSYGIPQHRTVVVLAQGAPAQIGVPISEEDFIDSFSGWNSRIDGMSGANWRPTRTGVGYDLTDDPAPYGAWIGPGGDLQTRMLNRNASAFLRLIFTVDNPDRVLFLRLRMRWDDGFVAYLNGIPIAAHLAPPILSWDANATGERLDELNKEWTEFLIPASTVTLLPGDNLLAIHGLNHHSASPNFLILPTLEIVYAATNNAPAYFMVPTPGGANDSGDVMGPLLTEPTTFIPRPLGNAGSPVQIVMVHVANTIHEMDPNSVRMIHRTQFGMETSVSLRDDGVAPDALAGDGVYSGHLPTSQVGRGQVLRWRFEAADVLGHIGRAPLFLDPEDNDEYFGTVAENPDELTSQLPLFHLLVQDIAAAETLAGTRACAYYLDRFYDNIRINLHGQSSRGFPKKSHNLDFNRDNRFTWHPDAIRTVKDVDLLSNYADKTRVRNTLAHEVGRRAGTPSHFAFPVRVQRNGNFHGVMDMIEDSDDRMLERNELDPDGALYKIYNDLSNTQRVRKKTRKHEDDADLKELIEALNPSRPLALRHVVAYDILNLPATINYLVTRQLNSDRDHGHKNYLLYRDTNGTREWQPIIWDVDLSWGHNWNEPFHYFDDSLYFDNPLDAHAGDNRLYYLIYAFPELRAMFLRRMRTLMDNILQPPEIGDGDLESFMRALVATIDPDPAEPSPWTDGDLDFDKWGTWGRGLRARSEVDFVINQYLLPRRTFLFDTSPGTRPRLPRNSGDPIPDQPQINLQEMVMFGTVEALPDSGNPAEQYLVLHNQTPHAVDLSGWSIQGAISHVFPGGAVIPAGSGSASVHYRGLLHVVRDAFAFRSRATGPTGGQRRLVQGNFQGYLPPRGGMLQLRDERGDVIASMTYPGQSTPWQDHLRISELQYHPALPTTAESAAMPWTVSNDYEFIELINTGDLPLPMNNVSFQQGIRFTFPPIDLAPHTRLILAKNIDAFANRYPDVQAPVVGPYDGLLDNSGERLTLIDPFGEPILDFAYLDRWYPATDGTGHSLVLRDPYTTATSDFSRAISWAISLIPGGSPGQPDFGFAQAYHGWDNFHFNETELGLPAVAHPDADPDFDGLANWIEYAFGLDPRNPDQLRIEYTWIDVAGRRQPALQFRRAANALDLTFELLATGSLSTPSDSWTTVATTAHSIVPIDLFTELSCYLDVQPPGSTARFLQIRITFTP